MLYHFALYCTRTVFYAMCRTSLYEVTYTLLLASTLNECIINHIKKMSHQEATMFCVYMTEVVTCICFLFTSIYLYLPLCFYLPLFTCICFYLTVFVCNFCLLQVLYVSTLLCVLLLFTFNRSYVMIFVYCL